MVSWQSTPVTQTTTAAVIWVDYRSSECRDQAGEISLEPPTVLTVNSFLLVWFFVLVFSPSVFVFFLHSFCIHFYSFVAEMGWFWLLSGQIEMVRIFENVGEDEGWEVS